MWAAFIFSGSQRDTMQTRMMIDPYPRPRPPAILLPDQPCRLQFAMGHSKCSKRRPGKEQRAAAKEAAELEALARDTSTNDTGANGSKPSHLPARRTCHLGIDRPGSTRSADMPAGASREHEAMHHPDRAASSQPTEMLPAQSTAHQHVLWEGRPNRRDTGWTASDQSILVDEREVPHDGGKEEAGLPLQHVPQRDNEPTLDEEPGHQSHENIETVFITETGDMPNSPVLSPVTPPGDLVEQEIESAEFPSDHYAQRVGKRCAAQRASPTNLSKSLREIFGLR